MASIVLNGNTMGYNYGLESFKSVTTALNKSKSSTTSLAEKISRLNNVLSNYNARGAGFNDDIAMAQEAIENAEPKSNHLVEAVSTIDEKTEALLDTAVEVDNKVAKLINSKKKSFYKKYPHLKPECERSWAEKAWDHISNGIHSGVQFFSDIGNAIKNCAIVVWDWVKENWDFVKKIITGVLLIASIVILVFIPGVGPLLAAAALSCLISTAISLVVNGVCNLFQGKGLFDGAWDAAFTGSVTGFIGGGISAMLVGFPAMFGRPVIKGVFEKSIKNAIIRFALSEAIASGASNYYVTFIDSIVTTQDLLVSMNEASKQGISAFVIGGITGAVFSSASYLKSGFKDNKMTKEIVEIASNNEKGKKGSKYIIERLKQMFPDWNFETERYLSNDAINIESGFKYGNRMDVIGYKNNVDGSITVKLFEIKSTNTAGFTPAQISYWQKNNNMLVDDVILKSKNFGPISVPKGTPVTVIRTSQTTKILGSHINPISVQSLSNVAKSLSNESTAQELGFTERMYVTVRNSPTNTYTTKKDAASNIYGNGFYTPIFGDIYNPTKTGNNVVSTAPMCYD